MSGAIIYLAIVVVWALVLVPRWLRRHDAPPQARDDGSDREPSGRVLTRRAAAPETGTDAEDAVPPRASRDRERDVVARERRRARRRRVAFLALLLAAAGCATAAGYGYVTWWSLGAPGLFLALYFVHVRRVVVAERVRHRRSGARVAEPPEPGDNGVEASPASLQEYRRSRVAPGLRVVGRGELFDQDAGEPWLPQPVPLPTYLTAPAAPRAYEPTVSVEDYDEGTATVDDAPAYPRAVGD